MTREETLTATQKPQAKQTLWRANVLKAHLNATLAKPSQELVLG
jgi:hypothetical protein